MLSHEPNPDLSTLLLNVNFLFLIANVLFCIYLLTVDTPKNVFNRVVKMCFLLNNVITKHMQNMSINLSQDQYMMLHFDKYYFFYYVQFYFIRERNL